MKWRIDSIEMVSIRSSNEISSIKTHISTIYGLTIDPRNDQLQVGLILAQRTGGALHQHRRGQGLSPVQA